jgi:hypothetical protein
MADAAESRSRNAAAISRIALRAGASPEPVLFGSGPTRRRRFGAVAAASIAGRDRGALLCLGRSRRLGECADAQANDRGRGGLAGGGLATTSRRIGRLTGGENDHCALDVW